MTLTGKQRRTLRALGHHLEPVVMLGKEGITSAVIGAVDQALSDHELVKIRVGESSPVDRHEAAETLASRTNSEVAQVLGRTLLLYRRHPDEPKIAVPGMPPPQPKKKTEQNRSSKPAHTKRNPAGRART